MDGLLIIDKPAGITSHDVVDRVRRILKTRRVGHTGTLDPFATGVLVMLVGKATRLAQFLDKDEKEYEAVLRFGFETDTGDSTGRRKEKVKSRELPTVDEVLQILATFTGEIEQVPPMYSAKKIAGKKLYEQARQGIDIKRRPQKVTIGELALSEPHAAADALTQRVNTIAVRVVCSAGTYVRTLAEDIGRALGTAAHLGELRRTRAGRFDLSKSQTLDELENLDEPSKSLLPAKEAVAHLPALTMAEDRLEATRNGLSTRIPETALAAGDAIRMLDAEGNLLAVGIYDEPERSIRPKVVVM